MKSCTSRLVELAAVCFHEMGIDFERDDDNGGWIVFLQTGPLTCNNPAELWRAVMDAERLKIQTEKVGK